MPGQWTTYAKEVLTVDAPAKVLASAPDEAEACYITVEDADVRWWDDGSDPTSTEGHPIKADGDLWYEGNMANLRFTAVSGVPVLHVTYYVH